MIKLFDILKVLNFLFVLRTFFLFKVIPSQLLDSLLQECYSNSFENLDKKVKVGWTFFTATFIKILFKYYFWSIWFKIHFTTNILVRFRVFLHQRGRAAFHHVAEMTFLSKSCEVSQLKPVRLLNNRTFRFYFNGRYVDYFARLFLKFLENYLLESWTLKIFWDLVKINFVQFRTILLSHLRIIY